MTVKIIPQSDNFHFVGENKGLLLRVDSAERLTRYNRDLGLLDIDLQLYTGFAAIHNIPSLYSMIDKLVNNYGLQRRNKQSLKHERFAPSFAQYLTEIRSLPDASINTIDIISEKFSTLQKYFTQELKRNSEFPEVSLSKLLHFVHPSSFWIIDSLVQSVLRIWGYPNNFSGFGNFLQDLFRDPEFENFRTFLIRKDRELVGNHPMNSLPYPFLKLLDKLLWSR